MSEEKALYDVVGAFQSIEEDLIKSMQRTMKRHIGEDHQENINWSQWQAEMLNGLAQFKEENADKLKGYYSTINDDIDATIRQAYATGESETEAEILKAIKNGYKAEKVGAGTAAMQGAFFAVNSRKLNSLIKSTQDDFKKAEHSILRRTEDIYRQTIFKTQMHYNTGAKSLWQAVDMAAKDFLAAGINSIEYKNGARVNIASYAEMALRTANKRANLAGCGDKRTEYGIYDVIISKHNAACPLCIKWQGKVYIDDVYQNPPKDVKGHTRLSVAVRGGMFHPNCKNGVGTYYEGITEKPNPPTKEEKEEMERVYNLTQRQRECERNIRKYSRLSMGMQDAENAAKYSAKADQWKAEYNKLIRNNKDVLRREPERLRLYGVGAIPGGTRTKAATPPPRNVVKFANAATTKEASQFIRDNFGINCDYGRLNVNIANEWNRALTRSFNQFPELVNNFGFVGSCQQRNKGVKKAVTEYFTNCFKTNSTDPTAIKYAQNAVKTNVSRFMRRMSVSQYTMAQSWSPSANHLKEFRGVCINERQADFKTIKAAKESLQYQVDVKFHPNGCNNVGSVLDHEIGHQLDNMLGLRDNKTIQDLYNSRTTSKITTDLSEYAWNNSNKDRYGEFIAEAWSEYQNNPHPRDIATNVGETIINAYNKKFGGK